MVVILRFEGFLFQDRVPAAHPHGRTQAAVSCHHQGGDQPAELNRPGAEAVRPVRSRGRHRHPGRRGTADPHQEHEAGRGSGPGAGDDGLDDDDDGDLDDDDDNLDDDDLDDDDYVYDDEQVAAEWHGHVKFFKREIFFHPPSMMSRPVPDQIQILTKMEGVGCKKNVFIIGASNRLDIIDPAGSTSSSTSRCRTRRLGSASSRPTSRSRRWPRRSISLYNLYNLSIFSFYLNIYRSICPTWPR